MFSQIFLCLHRFLYIDKFYQTGQLYKDEIMIIFKSRGCCTYCEAAPCCSNRQNIVKVGKKHRKKPIKRQHKSKPRQNKNLKIPYGKY